MTWLCVETEVAAIFHNLSGGYLHHAVEEWLYQGRKKTDEIWVEHGKWWRQTTRGKAYFRAYGKERHARMAKTVVAVRACVACGKVFEVSAANQEKKRGRVCSTACRGASRKNIRLVKIGSAKKPLAHWAKEQGLGISTVWARIKRGWPVERALGFEAA